MALAMSIVLGWQFGVTWLYKKKGWALPGENQPQQTASTQPAAASATTQGAAASSVPATGPGAVEPTAGGMRVVAEAGLPQPAVLGSAVEKDPTYSMQLALDPTGAGVKAVLLNDFRQSAD